MGSESVSHTNSELTDEQILRCRVFVLRLGSMVEYESVHFQIDQAFRDVLVVFNENDARLSAARS